MVFLSQFPTLIQGITLKYSSAKLPSYQCRVIWRYHNVYNTSWEEHALKGVEFDNSGVTSLCNWLSHKFRFVMFFLWYNRYIMQQKWQYIIIYTYYQISNIRSIVDNKVVDHSDVVAASPVGAAPTTSSFSTWLDTWLQWIGQRQLRDETRNV